MSYVWEQGSDKEEGSYWRTERELVDRDLFLLAHAYRETGPRWRVVVEVWSLDKPENVFRGRYGLGRFMKLRAAQEAAEGCMDRIMAEQ